MLCMAARGKAGTMALSSRAIVFCTACVDKKAEDIMRVWSVWIIWSTSCLACAGGNGVRRTIASSGSGCGTVGTGSGLVFGRCYDYYDDEGNRRTIPRPDYWAEKF